MTWPGRIRPRTRSMPGQMNKTERAYAQQLDLLLRAGEIRSYGFEALKFRLADRTFYTPDFYVVYPDHIELQDVKGFYKNPNKAWEEDARVKIKVAAQLYPEFLFVGVRKTRDGWEREEF